MPGAPSSILAPTPGSGDDILSDISHMSLYTSFIKKLYSFEGLKNLILIKSTQKCLTVYQSRHPTGQTFRHTTQREVPPCETQDVPLGTSLLRGCHMNLVIFLLQKRRRLDVVLHLRVELTAIDCPFDSEPHATVLLLHQMHDPRPEPIPPDPRSLTGPLFSLERP